jgi:sortase A
VFETAEPGFEGWTSMGSVPHYGRNSLTTASKLARVSTSVLLVSDTLPSTRDDTDAGIDALTVTTAPTEPSPPAPKAPLTPEPKLTRRGRVRKWDRPPASKDWRWWVGGLGKALITAGLLTFGFVAYQLWGTGIETARAQRTLETQFEELLAETPAPATTVVDNTPATTEPAVDPGIDDTAEVETGAETTTPLETVPPDEPVVIPVADQNLPTFEEGDAVARLEIPAIGVNDIVVAGVSTKDLKKGPGHFPDTPLPGQLGNSAIAGHRTTYGQPFHNVDKLDNGDEIVVTTPAGRFVYRVTGQQIVSPSDYQVVATTDPTRATITLTSCHPKWSASQRIIITGELDPIASADVGEPVINYGRPLDIVEPDDTEIVSTLPSDSGSADADSSDSDLSTPISDPESDVANETPSDPLSAGNDDQTNAAVPGSAAANAGIADAFAEGWFSDSGAFSQVAIWSAVLVAVVVLSYMLRRKFRNDFIGWTICIVPLMVVLYFFYQNVNRLLPPNL